MEIKLLICIAGICGAIMQWSYMLQRKERDSFWSWRERQRLLVYRAINLDWYPIDPARTSLHNEYDQLKALIDCSYRVVCAAKVIEYDRDFRKAQRVFDYLKLGTATIVHPISGFYFELIVDGCPIGESTIGQPGAGLPIEIAIDDLLPEIERRIEILENLTCPTQGQNY